MILTYNETGWQEKSPKCQDGLEVLMSNARALEKPKRRREQVRLLNGYTLYMCILQETSKRP